MSYELVFELELGLGPRIRLRIGLRIGLGLGREGVGEGEDVAGSFQSVSLKNGSVLCLLRAWRVALRKLC